jgi:hypothetical protein
MEGSVHFLYLNVKTIGFTAHNVVPTDHILNQKSRKIKEIFLILIASQIVNLKMIGDVLVLIKCYQCGGETLGPVVKHSVRDTVHQLMIHLHCPRAGQGRAKANFADPCPGPRGRATLS